MRLLPTFSTYVFIIQVCWLCHSLAHIVLTIHVRRLCQLLAHMFFNNSCAICLYTLFNNSCASIVPTFSTYVLIISVRRLCHFSAPMLLITHVRRLCNMFAHFVEYCTCHYCTLAFLVGQIKPLLYISLCSMSIQCIIVHSFFSMSIQAVIAH